MEENNIIYLEELLKKVSSKYSEITNTKIDNFAWLSGNILKGNRPNDRALFSDSGKKDTEISPSKHSIYYFKNPIFVKYIYIYSNEINPFIEIEVLSSSSAEWKKLNLQHKKDDDHSFISPSIFLIGIRLRSTKSYGKQELREKINKVKVWGIPMPNTLRSVNNIGSITDSIEELTELLDQTVEHCQEIQPDIEALEKEKTELEKSVVALRISEDERQQAIAELNGQRSQTVKLEKENDTLQQNITDQQATLNKLKTDIGQYSTDLAGHNKTLRRHALMFILVSIIFGFFLFTALLYIYPKLDETLNIYLENPKIDWQGLISLKLFYGAFVAIILFGLEEATRKSFKAALQLLNESRDINAALVLVNSLVDSSAQSANLKPEDVFNERASAKIQAFNTTRYEHLAKIKIQKKSFIAKTADASN